jgi:hypothetical protein
MSGAATATIFATAVGAYTANQAGQRADAARSQQNAYLQQGLQMSLDEKNYYRQKFGPLMDTLLSESMSSGPSAGYGLALGGLRSKFQAAYKKLESDSRGMGINPTAGSIRALDIEGAKAEANLRLQDEEMKGKTRLSLMNFDKSFGASQQALGQMNQLAGFQGQQANNEQKSADQGWAGVAQGIGNLARYYGKKSNPNEGEPDVTPTTPAPVTGDQAGVTAIAKPAEGQANQYDFSNPSGIMNKSSVQQEFGPIAADVKKGLFQ